MGADRMHGGVVYPVRIHLPCWLIKFELSAAPAMFVGPVHGGAFRVYNPPSILVP